MQRRSARALLSIAAVVAATTGVVALTAAATPNSSGASALVPITPCRLLDTRPGTDTVGTRSTPLGANEVHTVDVWGSNGNCTIPSGATGVSLNVVSISPTASSFLTVFPADVTRPAASSLNWVAGQAPTPNAVTARLSADGRLSLFNLAGTVNLAVDVVGYYEPVGAGETGPQGPAGPQGAPGVDPSRIIWVAESGGDFTDLSDALASITDNDPEHRYLVRIAPGIFTENAGIDLKNYVGIQGSGASTVIRSDGSGTAGAAVRASGVVSAVSDLTIESSGLRAITASLTELDLSGVDVSMTGAGATTAITATNGTSDLSDVEVRMLGGVGDPTGVSLTGGTALMDGLQLDFSGDASSEDCVGLTASSTRVELTRSRVLIDGCTGTRTGVSVSAGSLLLRQMYLNGFGVLTTQQRGVVVSGSTEFSIDELDANLSGTNAHAVVVDGANGFVRASRLIGNTNSVQRLSGNVILSASVITNTAGMSGRCADTVDANYAPVSCT